MNPTQRRTGELIAGIAGIGLLITTFLPWLGVSGDEAGAAQGLGAAVDLPTTNAWESFTFLDIALLVPVVAAIGLALLALGSGRPTPRAVAALVAAIGAVTALAILYRMIRPVHDASLEFGIFLALGCSFVMVLGAWLAMDTQPDSDPGPVSQTS